MTEQSQDTPNGEDRVLDQQLLALKRLTPVPGFENRVLSRVWRPAPMFVLVWKDNLARFFSPTRRWMLAGAASLGSLVSAVSFGHLVTDLLLPSRLGQRALAAGAGDISWDRVSAAAGSLVATVAGAVSTVPAFSSLHWTTVALGAAAVELISLAGLYLLVRRPVRERVRSYASR